MSYTPELRNAISITSYNSRAAAALGAGATFQGVGEDVSALISTDKGTLVRAWSVAKDSTLAVPDIADAEITGYRGDLFCFTFTNSAADTDQVGATVSGFIDL